MKTEDWVTTLTAVTFVTATLVLGTIICLDIQTDVQSHALEAHGVLAQGERLPPHFLFFACVDLLAWMVTPSFVGVLLASLTVLELAIACRYLAAWQITQECLSDQHATALVLFVATFATHVRQLASSGRISLGDGIVPGILALHIASGIFYLGKLFDTRNFI